jgi:trk system potassium uptake protein TrkH
VAGFAITILFGTVLLMLPGMTVEGGINLVNALFTATSAVCVTGLVVVDTGTYFTRAGQGIILLLIQIGGLGIFTFSTFFMLILRGKTTLRGHLLIQETMTHFPYRNLLRLLRNIIFFTFGAEALGALCLWIVFKTQFDGATAVYASVFHSVSAFCNAGFSLWATSFENYSGNIPVTVTIMTLIILGGLGFTVVTEVGTGIFRKSSESVHLSLNTRIVLATTLALIVGGALLFWLLERHNVLASRPVSEQVLASVFQSVTARTAGFNTVRTAGLTSAALFVLIGLMFIGASPGSVGGGVKTTTFAVYVMMIYSYVRGKENVELFGRTIPHHITSKTLATIGTSIGLIMLSALLIQIIESLGKNPAEHTHFLDWLFEVVSAFGTVGLSTGETPGLKDASKLVIIATMFAGRVGPLGLALSLVGRESTQRYKYPEENVMIG